MGNPFATIQSKVLRESQAIIDVINNSLKDLFGVDTITGLPIFRVIWSHDELEIRHGTFDDFVPGTKIFLRTVTETREVPKYRQWADNRHILERLVIVPEINMADIPNNKLSYEPLYVFEDNSGNYIAPTLEGCKFIIDTVLEAQTVKKMMIGEKDYNPNDRRLVRYADPEGTHEGALEAKRKRVDNLVEELFGDESSLGTETFTESGRTIIVPHKQFGEN